MPRWLAPAVFAVVLLGACATPRAPMPLRPHAAQSVAAQSVRPVPAAQDVPLMLIGAELALQKGDLAEAARFYGDAAHLSADAAIAEQATRTALAARQWALAQQSLERWQVLAPGASGIVQARAWIALAEGDEERARAELVALAGSNPTSGWRQVAQVLLGAADKASAARMLAAVATPDRLGASESNWTAMSQLALRLGDAALAERLSAAAVKRFHSADGYAWSAQLALDRGDKALARRQYAEALRRDPSSLRLRTGHAALLDDSGDPAGAARALSTGKQDDVTFAARAAYAARADDKPLLGALYREIEADKGARSGKRLLLLGQVAEALERPHEAIRWYGEVPESDERWFAAGMRIVVLADAEGDLATSRARLADLRAMSGADAERAVDLYLLEAELLARKSRKADAMAVYMRGLEQFPADPRLLYAKAMLAIDLDDIAAAESDLRRIIADDADSAEALNALGYTLADRTDRIDEALALVSRALELKPDEASIIDSYGWVHFRLGHVDVAVRELRRAHAKAPDAEIAAHLGEALWASGARDEARDVWEKARKNDPDNPVLLETIRRLAS